MARHSEETIISNKSRVTLNITATGKASAEFAMKTARNHVVCHRNTNGYVE